MSNNIPSIYNYCDRWCERCYFTASCAVFQSEKEVTAEQKDPNNKAFWDKIADNFKKAKEMIIQGALNHGIDLSNIPSEEMREIERKEEETDRLLEQDDLINLCKKYANEAGKVMENEGFWKQIADEMILQEKMGTVPIQQLEDQLDLIKECKEVINWYLFFIQVKFQRAVSGLIEGDEEEKEIQTDYNGSAKIALIAVYRSQQAWTQLFPLMPDEDRILPLLSLLSKIEKVGIEKFPKANEFVRPGFDQRGTSTKTIHENRKGIPY
jgi:hypothetical protein